MKNKKQQAKNILTGAFALCLMFVVFAHSAQAAPWSGSCVGGNLNVNNRFVDASDVATIQGLECAFGNVIGVVLALAGVVVFVTFVIGGFKYLTSGSDPKAVESAKQALTAAIAGLVVLVLAFVILLVIQTITGVQVTQFKVVTP